MIYTNDLTARAENAGAITDKEAALLEVYRTKLVRDTQGGLGVNDVRVYARGAGYIGRPGYGALVVRSSAESK